MKYRLYYLSLSRTGFIVCLRSLYLLILSVLFTDFVSDENNVISCASTTTDVTLQNQTWDEFITELTLDEMRILNDELGFNQRDFQIWNDLRNQNQDTTALANKNRFGWESLGLFIVGTIILFGISQYGDALISLLFNVGSNTTNAIARGAVGLIQFAQEAGQVPLLRQFMVERGQELLNDPDTANRVVNGMRHVAEFRQRT